MQPFTCPGCGTKSTFDPRIESALCPQCGYAPPQDMRVVPQAKKRAAVRGRPNMTATHQPYLDEILAHWNGTHMRYVRSYQPERRAILWFVGAYLLLRRGERAKAAQHLYDLTQLHPEFPDPWVWLAATTDDPHQRIDYLENAVLLDPAHPLARDALAIAQGRVLPTSQDSATAPEQEMTVVDCPQCGGALYYEPGAGQVACQFCDHALQLQQTNLLDGQATLMGDLRLQRRFQHRAWTDVQQVMHCRSCGAKLSMIRYIATQCAFCGSTSVRILDNEHGFAQPDGFLPFDLDEQGAAAELDRVQHSARQRVKTWWVGTEQEVNALQAVYLPFWVFDGFVQVRRQTVRTLDRESPQVSPRPRHESRPSKDLMMFDNLLFSAMDFSPPQLLRRILPFDLGALVPYEPRLLADRSAVLYQRDVEVVVEDAYNVMLAMAVGRARRPVASLTTDHAELRRAFQVTSATHQLVLLPVWVAQVRREDLRRLAMVNGQTGKVTVSAPLRGGS
jgi:predicted RNA-binding Zn-ribbon protein involved in translation (DUF1610 family)